MPDLVRAVKQLRKRLGESQQVFATRLGLSIRAVANYEKDRLPDGRALAAMHIAARDAGYSELAETFWTALHAKLGIDESAGAAIADAATDAKLAAAKVIALEKELAGVGVQISPRATELLKSIKEHLGVSETASNRVNPYALLHGERKGSK